MSWHVCSMSLADSLKALLKITSMTKTIISAAAASQGRAIVARSLLAIDAGTFMVAQNLIRMTTNACEGIALGKKVLFPSQRTAQATLQLIPEISRIIFEPHNDLSTLGSQMSAPGRFDNASFWILSCSLDNPKPYAEIQCSTYSDCQAMPSVFGSASFAASSTSILTNFFGP
ncbi:hypothetical protein BCV72DRAFT_300909 [Rhizopus microsporus var. microsporus]|uniref:Uncharacterized protein n=2 Tax=Rhizopus microsporus TaxID=58291 RepID=A0A2G4STH4_RHIZD|nr:uncharacterized protein RHIMIDRAFT_237904 [Rhizopus microsporus ATCC 52813]ORE11621.1 hypothetical protein BCV72DRAFT_300909 [Rhizopus microsporus var. microsporus]PHZ12088.1 hypothetical protein RHIMIDRAFT_237904 [Rhizopus microsporus ATCC 52813]